ncbi:MAG: hypothetical protein QOD11_281 [Bradyrhizobium sp.]|jgi:hypothetical protein|nr:hypothetical protein [Bradyrhizobium sp.]
MSLIDQIEITSSRRVWLRAFWGFSPEDEGYLGFTKEGNRTRFLREYRDGDLVLIYGADEKHTRPDQRRQLLGFLEIEPVPITNAERSSEVDRRWREENGFLDRWTFALPVKRAWRINRRIEAYHFAPKTFEVHQPMLIASRGELLTPAETEAVLTLPVSPTNVFGETPLLPKQVQLETTLQRLFEPSRGVTPSFGLRNFTVEDSQTSLYALGLEGDVAAFLGRERYEVVRKAVVKIGIAKDPQTRCDIHNTHLPPACAFRWTVMLKSRPFSGAAKAKEAEDQLKAILKDRFDSLGGEFFLVDENALQSEFGRVSPALFILRAPQA